MFQPIKCPQCLAEFTTEFETCPRCDSKLALAANEAVCANCGRLHLKSEGHTCPTKGYRPMRPAMTCCLLLAMLCAGPAYSQRVFRASEIDVQQNSRLDSLESRMEAMEASAAARAVKPEPVPDPVPDAVPAKVVAVAAVAPKPVSVRQPPAPPVQTAVVQPYSSRYSTEELRAQIRRYFPKGWTGPRWADVSPRSSAKAHLLESQHGFTWDQIAGLTQDEALALHDLAPTHGNKISPVRRGQAVQRAAPVQAVPAYRTGQYQNPAIQVPQWDAGCASGQCAKQQMQSGCANGQCANQVYQSAGQCANQVYQSAGQGRRSIFWWRR